MLSEHNPSSFVNSMTQGARNSPTNGKVREKIMKRMLDMVTEMQEDMLHLENEIAGLSKRMDGVEDRLAVLESTVETHPMSTLILSSSI